METWPVDRLRPYERNSRRHSAEQIEQIAASIRQWGWTMPILTADDGMVLAGHGRLAAGKLLGMTEVPVIVARGWTDQQKRAYVIADNRLTDASDWDDEILRLELSDLVEGGFDVALTGISEDELSKLSVGVDADAGTAGWRSVAIPRHDVHSVRPAIRGRRASGRQGDQAARPGQSQSIAARQCARGHLRGISRARLINRV
ncbi:ParB/Srx family N-terminal domain-containing protein [Bradyrhizobium sp. TZ2]